VRRLPDEAAAEPVASPLRPPQAAEVLAAAVRRREAPVAVARPRVASDARPQPAAVVAGGSPAAEAEAAGSPAAAVPAAAPVARQTAVAPPMAACGWRYRAAVREVVELFGKLRMVESPPYYAYASVRSGKLGWRDRTDTLLTKAKLTALHKQLLEAAAALEQQPAAAPAAAGGNTRKNGSKEPPKKTGTSS